jgi:hypothetical protein
MEAFLVCAPRLKERLVCRRVGDVIQSSGRGFCVVQGAIRSPVYINVKKGYVAVPLRLHGELNIPAKDIQMVTKPLQLLCSAR